MRGDDAKEKCPEIILVKGKLNLNLLDILGERFAALVASFSPYDRLDVSLTNLELTIY